MAEATKCKHPMCSCMAKEGSDFCCMNCEDSKDMTTLACDCPHAACTGHAV